MVQDTYNVIPVTLAVLLHTLVFGSLFVAFDMSQSAAPPMPLMIKATLVVEDTMQPPVVQEPVPPPEPEPEPEPVQPDPDEEDRNQAEDDKRVADDRLEKSAWPGSNETAKRLSAKRPRTRRVASVRPKRSASAFAWNWKPSAYAT